MYLRLPSVRLKAAVSRDEMDLRSAQQTRAQPQQSFARYLTNGFSRPEAAESLSSLARTLTERGGGVALACRERGAA